MDWVWVYNDVRKTHAESKDHCYLHAESGLEVPDDVDAHDNQCELKEDIEGGNDLPSQELHEDQLAILQTDGRYRLLQLPGRFSESRSTGAKDCIAARQQMLMPPFMQLSEQ